MGNEGSLCRESGIRPFKSRLVRYMAARGLGHYEERKGPIKMTPCPLLVCAPRIGNRTDFWRGDALLPMGRES